MKKLLITGFDPFGGETVNPAWEAVKLLPDHIGNYMLCKLQIPTVFGLGAATVLEAAATIQPDAILCVGQAGGRAAVTPERIAVNIRDAKISDNAGNRPIGEFVTAEGPAAYFSTLPIAAMAQAIRDAGLPGAVSNSAGAFVCIFSDDQILGFGRQLPMHGFKAVAVSVGACILGLCIAVAVRRA